MVKFRSITTFYYTFVLILSFPAFTWAQKVNTDSLTAIVNSQKHDSTEVRALCQLGTENAKSNSAKALQYYHQAIHVGEAFSHGAWLGVSYMKLALLQTQSGSNDSARFYLAKGEQMLTRYPRDMNLRYNFLNASGIFSKNIGKYEDAIKFYEEMVTLDTKYMSKEDRAGNYLNLSNVYTKMGKLYHAQEYLFKALKIFEDIKNETGMAFCYNGLGNQFYKEKNYTKAEYYLRKSIELKEKSGNKKSLATGLNGLAVLYMDLKEYDKAHEYINRSISLSQEAGMKDPLIIGYINKGMIYSQQGKSKDAEEWFLKGKALATELQNQNFLSIVNSELGKIYQQQSDQNKALNSFIQGVEQAKQSKSLDTEEDAHKLLAEFYYKNGQYKEAYDEYKDFHNLYVEVEGGTVKSKVYDLQAKYENEKKESQIKLLQKDSLLQAAILRQQKTVGTALGFAVALIIIISFLLLNRYRLIHKATRQLEIERMRNNIARDLHDDIGSTLSSINIISQLAAKENMSPHLTQHFQKIGEQSTKIMESLSDMVWSINADNDSLEKMLVRMKEFSSEILESRNIDYKFEGENTLNGTVLNVEQRKNIFLIFKETINNTVKYSESTFVTIALYKKNNNLFMDISDNGKGFNMNQIRLGNGLRNIQERAKEINAVVKIESAEGRGSLVHLELALLSR